jgi:UDP-N-acetylmuramate dehydrogenase
MNIAENVSLSGHSTMRLGGPARYLAEANSAQEVKELVDWAKSQKLPFRMIGGGSNIVWRDSGYPGLIIVNKILGKEIIRENESELTLRVGGGENWDELVGWSVDKNLHGIEFLSLIPGSVGAAPVQNIGAYGGEIATCLEGVSVYDTEQDCLMSLEASDCAFRYRNSRFKTEDQGRFMITHIVLTLKKQNPEPPFYEALEAYFRDHAVDEYTPNAVREAVISIRSAKLPDWRVVANNGSFFTNPFVTKQHFDELQAEYPDIKGWPSKDGRVKLAAGWLVEKAGFKGYHDEATGMATWDKQALVLVNEHARTTADLLEFRQKIIFKVDELFGVTLEQEPELLP